MGKNFEKTKVLREEYRNWREHQHDFRQGFFPIFNDFLTFLPNLSGGACLLYLYFGLHAKNKTGESFHDVKRIAQFFGKTPRTIREWIAELEEKRLIERMQVKFNGVTYTYLLPYGEDAEPYLKRIEQKKTEIDASSEPEL